MVSSLSNLVNNLSKEVHRIKCKYGHDDKKCETCTIKYKYCDCFLEYANLKNILIECKRLCCKFYQWKIKNYERKFDKKLIERFFNAYIFSNLGNNKFILLLWKGIYPYECMDDQEKLNEAPFPEKEDFYSHLNMKGIIDVDYAHAKRVCKDFETKKLDNVMIGMFKVIHYC